MNKHKSLGSGGTKRQCQAGVWAAQLQRSLSLGQGQSLNISEPPVQEAQVQSLVRELKSHTAVWHGQKNFFRKKKTGLIV